MILQVLSLFVMISILYPALYMTLGECLLLLQGKELRGGRNPFGQWMSQSEMAGLAAIFVVAAGTFAVATLNLADKVSKCASIARRIILVTYPYAISLIYLILIVIPVWILFDASFHPALICAQYDLGILDQVWRGGVDGWYNVWSALSTRITSLLTILYALPFLVVIAVARVILTRPRKRHIVVISFALAAFTTICHQYDHMVWHASKHRVTKILPQFQAAIEPLRKQWPTESGSLPEAGAFFAHEQFPDEIMLQQFRPYGLNETFGYVVSRLPDGGVQFSLEPHYLFYVEWHPPSRRPTAEPDSETTVEKAELATEWYLTQYPLIEE